MVDQFSSVQFSSVQFSSVQFSSALLNFTELNSFLSIKRIRLIFSINFFSCHVPKPKNTFMSEESQGIPFSVREF